MRNKLLRPGTHGFWVMLLFAVSMLLVRLAVGDSLEPTNKATGGIILPVLFIVPAWLWLQYLARSLKVTCPACGQWRMRFTGRFPLVRRFHCDACEYDYDALPHRHDDD